MSFELWREEMREKVRPLVEADDVDGIVALIEAERIDSGNETASNMHWGLGWGD